MIYYELSVEDHGCGISQEAQKKLFFDFSKFEENSSLNKNGVGLGLSICKQLIETMNGTVSVDSELGRGTKFTISFKTTCTVPDTEELPKIQEKEECKREPCLSLEKESDDISRQLSMYDFDFVCFNGKSFDSDSSYSGKSGDAKPASNGLPTLLLVNDNVTILNVVSESLESNFQVTTADCGVDALAILMEKDRHFDIIVLDINMPIMDGFELCEKIGSYLSGCKLGAMMKINVVRPQRSESDDLLDQPIQKDPLER